MTVQFECPSCRRQMSAKREYAGKGGTCKCGTAVIVPGHPDKMKFTCSHCKKAITISNRHAGKQGRCPLCKEPITVPHLGIAIQSIEAPVAAQSAAATRPVVPLRSPQAASAPAPAKAPAAMIPTTCLICKSSVRFPQEMAGQIVECQTCGSYVEVPGAEVPAGRPAAASAKAAAKPAPGSELGKIKCPSCQRKLASDSPICTHCGIFIKSGRPILISGGLDIDEVEEKAYTVVRGLSWIMPFGIYPVYSEAIGNHKPFATWGIVAVTAIISFWFLALDYSGSSKMMSAKNLMLWSSNACPDAESIQMFYEYTSYGDAEAFIAKCEELSETTPEDQLDVAALNALNDQQRCFGEFRFYQLITHAFLHGGFFHFAGNMFFLFVFGSRVNAAIGNIKTLILYPILAVAAAMTFLVTLGNEPPTPMLGASGAVMGIAGAYLLLFPIHRMHMVIWKRWGLITGFHLSFKCFAVRGFWVVLFYIMFDVVAVSLMLDTGTAHWAHIGGLIWGFLLAFVLIVARLAYTHSDVVSLLFGKHAWKLIGTPADRME